MNDDDISIWLEEIQSVTPLWQRNNCVKKRFNININKTTTPSPTINPSPLAPLPEGEGKSKSPKSTNITITQIKVRYPNYDHEPRTIRLGKIDNTMMRQLRLQRLHITHKIDLHDMSLSYAYNELHKFLCEAWQAQTKIALVITGKGNKNYGNNEITIGELRRNLPRWCIEPNFQPMVVALSQAYPHHGGAGAFYVQIRRN